ncbi:MAG: tetratricopeptide repeat protein [Sideroxydans sp.]|nr:tetratricopeptide repeat protein [Sideroxydans sp.]
MSLLLDARKKSQGGKASDLELSLEASPYSTAPSPYAAAPANPDNTASARNAGQNLFNAKTAARTHSGGVHKSLLYALGATLVLFALGAVYVWQEISAPPPRYRAPVASTPITSAPATPQLAPVQVVNTAPLVADLAPASEAVSVSAVPPSQAATLSGTPKTPRVARAAHPPKFASSTASDLDELLNQAYQEYRAGSFDMAQPHYQAVLAKEPNNIDALLGLAAIAQHHHADAVAASYYARVLAQDPRNAVANAGMTALTTDDNRESRLKTLLHEQPNAASLHFALGNHYAEQARWSEAQQAYFNAYKLEPNNAELAFNLAVSLERLGQHKLSAQYYQQAVARDKNNSAGFNHDEISQRAQQLSQ